jgi:large subunit ribosomal protein L4
MQSPLYNQEGTKTGTIDLPDEMFGVRWNAALVKQVIDAELANRRKPVAHTKIRSEVSGGGKKPWKQKGTGRARQGSTRSPLWKGGGTTFGPRTTTVYAKRINKKMRRAALFAVLSAKLRDNECLFIDAFTLTAPKTKEFAKIVKALPGIAGRTFMLVSPNDKMLERASRNVRGITVCKAANLNALDLLKKTHILIPKASLDIIKKTFLK